MGKNNSAPQGKGNETGSSLPPAALRALAEAEARRGTCEKQQPPKELGGRGGKDPARYGDWEINGRTVDF